MFFVKKIRVSYKIAKLESLDAHQTYLYGQASYILNHEKKICEKPEVMLISLSFIKNEKFSKALHEFPFLSRYHHMYKSKTKN